MSNKRKNNEAMPAISVRLRQEQIDECERLHKKLGLESRNDFIRDAIDFYCEYLRCPESVKFLTPALESVISAKIRDTESRLSNIQFKMLLRLKSSIFFSEMSMKRARMSWMNIEKPPFVT